MQLFTNEIVTVIGAPVDAALNPSRATLSGTSYSSSDSSVFTVAPDPAVPNGAIVTVVGVGSATLTETATATEPDGKTTEQISGAIAITVEVAPPPPPPPAAGLVFTFGTPTKV